MPTPRTSQKTHWETGQVAGWKRTGRFLNRGRHSQPEIVLREDGDDSTVYVLKRRFPHIMTRQNTEELRPMLESVALRRLRHPNIVAVEDWGRDSLGHEYVVMPMVEGKPLSQGVALPIERLIPLYESFLNAITYLHEQGVAHGDLATCNVLVTPQDEIVLLDFAGAVVRMDDGSLLTESKHAHSWEQYVERDLRRVARAISYMMAHYAQRGSRRDWIVNEALPQELRDALQLLIGLNRSSEPVTNGLLWQTFEVVKRCAAQPAGSPQCCIGSQRTGTEREK